MKDRPICIRVARPEDLDSIVGFNAAIAAETEGKALDVATLRSGVLRALGDSADCTYFLAEMNGIVAGQTMVTYEWSDWRNGFFWWIQSVYVAPRFRRQGVFRELHRHIRNLAAKQQDVCGIRLYVHRENHGAQRTYRQLGMTETAYRLYEETWARP